MGGLLSYFYGQSNEPDPATGLTPREKSLVVNSWAIVRKDMIGNGTELFILFFTKFPKYLTYFPFRDVPFDQLRENKKVHAHAVNVMYALSSIVDNLSNVEVLVNLLSKTGEAHGRRKIPEQSFGDLKVTVLELLRVGLGSKITDEGIDAWNKTLEVAIKVIHDGMKEYYQKQQQKKAAAE